jgi:hypothetical protein
MGQQALRNKPSIQDKGNSTEKKLIFLGTSLSGKVNHTHLTKNRKLFSQIIY